MLCVCVCVSALKHFDPVEMSLLRVKARLKHTSPVFTARAGIG